MKKLVPFAAIAALCFSASSFADITPLNQYAAGDILTGSLANPNVIRANNNYSFLQSEVTNGDGIYVLSTNDPEKNGQLLADALEKLQKDPSIKEIRLSSGVYHFDSDEYQFILPEGDSIVGAGKGNTAIKVSPGTNADITVDENTSISNLTLSTPGSITLADDSISAGLDGVTYEFSNLNIAFDQLQFSLSTTAAEEGGQALYHVNVDHSLVEANNGQGQPVGEVPSNILVRLSLSNVTSNVYSISGALKTWLAKAMDNKKSPNSTVNNLFVNTVAMDLKASPSGAWICSALNKSQNDLSTVWQQTGTTCNENFLAIQSNASQNAAALQQSLRASLPKSILATIKHNDTEGEV